MQPVRMNHAYRAGKPVHVDDVSRGDVDCTCMLCDAYVIPKKGEVLQHHFAHSCEEGKCAGPTREGVLHAFAVAKIIARMQAGEALAGLRGAARGGEPRYEGLLYRADAMVGQVGIEVIVHNPMSDEKLNALADRDWIEVPLGTGLLHLIDRPLDQTAHDTLWAAIQRVASRDKPSLLAMRMRLAREAKAKAESEARTRADAQFCSRVGESMQSVRKAVRAVPVRTGPRKELPDFSIEWVPGVVSHVRRGVRQPQ